ncbi:hypothetical protein [Chelativorans sp. AA-79]|uniref:hypothetical protein n=1 Tax=Chelativorans sp. AA-79 TaxID=3028735 RepID=UPI0023F8ACA7|nr:hypothetical protein [Chelativorans sp. AA-79]WEX07382.1 hypothetical protein PVE73_14755 [Chelativorans sp. AA-79]
MSMSRFVVAFEGPGVEVGTIDVRDLAPALLSLSKAVDAANRAINGDKVPAQIQVRATAVGCFEVDLNLVLHGWEAIKGLLLSEDGQAAAQLLGWLGFIGTSGAGLIQLYRWLDGRIPDKAIQAGSSVTLKAGEESFTVPMEVLRLYREVSVNRAIGELLDTLEGERVERIEFRRGSGLPADEILTRADRVAFRFPEPEDETVVDDTRRMALSIRSLAFQEGNKWRLFDGQNVITATIDDKDFLARVDRNEVRFAKSDVLICMVQTVQKQGADGLKTEHTVKKVLEYKPAPLQIDMFSNGAKG